MVEWGGHHGGWGGFGPPSYIVKKCPGKFYIHLLDLTLRLMFHSATACCTIAMCKIAINDFLFNLD